jgi:hypothetical protein
LAFGYWLLALGIWLLASHPTLAAKLKNKSQLRRKDGAPTFMVEDRKEQMEGWASRLTSAAEAG